MEPMALQMDAATAISAGHSKGMPQVPQTRDMEKLRKTAQDFEAVFLSQMLKPMFDGIETEAPFGGGSAEKMYRSLMVEEYGKSIAQSGGIGLADSIMSEMLKMQEVQ